MAGVSVVANESLPLGRRHHYVSCFCVPELCSDSPVLCSGLSEHYSESSELCSGTIMNERIRVIHPTSDAGRYADLPLQVAVSMYAKL